VEKVGTGDEDLHVHEHPDEHFVISTYPKYPQVAIAAGFSGHGFKFCGVVGEILADLVTQGETSHPIGLFSPVRLAGRTGD